MKLLRVSKNWNGGRRCEYINKKNIIYQSWCNWSDDFLIIIRRRN